MARSIFVAAMLAVCVAVYAQPKDDKKEEASLGEIKVYIGDKEGKPVDLSGWSGQLIIEPKGMPKKTLKLDLAQPKETKAGKSAIDHGGQVVDMEGGYKVELVVEKGHEEHDKEHGEEDEQEGLAHLETKTLLQVYACPMKDSAPSEKQGKCPKCGMPLKQADMEFTAVAVFKTKDGTKNAKGFEWPPEVPATFPAAVARTDSLLKEIKDLIDKGDLAKVHRVAGKISQICHKLPSMAPKDVKADVEKLCTETIALFEEIDEAADAGKKEETLKVYEKYVAKVAALKMHAKEEHH